MSEKKTILFIARSMWARGGEQVFLDTLLGYDGFAKRYRAVVWSLVGEGEHSLRAVQLGDEYLFLNVRSVWRLLREGRRADVIHLNAVNGFSGALLAVLLRSCGKPLLLSVHGNMEPTMWDRWRFLHRTRKYIVGSVCGAVAHKVIFVSAVQRDSFIKRSFFKAQLTDKSVVAPNSINESIIAANGAAAVRVVFVGRFSKHKGALEYLSIAERFPEVPFYVIGKNFLKTQTFPPNVIVLGEYDHHDTLNWLQRSTILLSCSHDETFGLSILEAMAKGNVIISTDLPQIREWFSPGRNGFVFPVGDVQAAAAHLARCIEDPGLCQSIAENNTADARRFTTTQYLPRYLALYSELV